MPHEADPVPPPRTPYESRARAYPGRPVRNAPSSAAIAHESQSTRSSTRPSLAPSNGIFQRRQRLLGRRSAYAPTRRRTERQRRETFSFLGKRGAGPPRRAGGFSQNPPLKKRRRSAYATTHRAAAPRDLQLFGEARSGSPATSWGIFTKSPLKKTEEERLRDDAPSGSAARPSAFWGSEERVPRDELGDFHKIPP